MTDNIKLPSLKTGTPEADALLDHIYEYGTAAEGIHERMERLCQAYASEAVRETMGALMKPCVDKAWDRFQSAQTAPAAPQPAQPLTDEQIADDYFGRSEGAVSEHNRLPANGSLDCFRAGVRFAERKHRIGVKND